MLNNIITNRTIYEHLCRKIIGHAINLRSEKDIQDQKNLKHIIEDSKKAENVRQELITLINDLTPDDAKHCAHCKETKVLLKVFELKHDKKVNLCPPCYRIILNTYTGSGFEMVASN